MVTITDQFCISVWQFIHSTNHSKFTVSQATHTVIGMNPYTCTSINSFFGFLKCCIRVTKSNRYTFSSNSTNKVFYTFTFWSKSNLIKKTISSLLPSTKFIHSRIFHISWVLSSLIFFSKVRTFKINTTNLGPSRFFVTCPNIFSYC